MIQRDYILRLIADLAEFVAKLLNLTRDELPLFYDAATARIEKLYDMSFDDFLAMGNDGLLRRDWPDSPELADGLAELLCQTAGLAAQLQKYQVHEVLMFKALYLYSHAETTGNTYSFNRVVAITEIKQKLGID